jgi:heme exporter protein A
VTDPVGVTVDLKNVEKRFGGRTALRRIDLRLAAGEFLALFGPNGAGKTTLSKIVAALLRPSRGEVLVGGEAPRGRNAVAFRRRIGVLSHQSFLYGHLSARENLLFYGGLYGLADLPDRVEQRLAAVGLARRAEDKVAGFSRGMVQRLAIARALLHDPGLLLLDEPHTGLDPAGARTLHELLAAVKAEGRTVLMVTHDPHRGLGLADRAVVLLRGRIVAEMDARGLGAAAFESRYLEAVGGAEP